MNRRPLSFRPLLPIATALALTVAGCAADTAAESTDTSGESADELNTAPVSASACKSLQSKNPQGATTTLSTGDVVAAPFRACDLNIAALFGTVVLAYAERLFEGTGYVPLSVVKDGDTSRRAIARLYFVNYLSSDLGPYNEFFVVIDGAGANASADAKTLKWANAFSSLLPSFGPENRTLVHQLILPAEAKKQIAYGRELLGVDKRPGTVELFANKGGMTFDVKDETGAPVVRGAFRSDNRLGTLVRSIRDLAGAAVGERLGPNEIAVKLHPLALNQPIELDAHSFSRDVASHSAEIKRTKATFHWLPSLAEASARTLDLEIDGSSSLGAALRDAHFTPAAFALGTHASFVVSPE